MSRGNIPKIELDRFLLRPKVCGWCGAAETEYNPLVLHHCFFRSHRDDEVTEKEWNFDWACVKHHTDGEYAAHKNRQVADHFRQRAIMRRDGIIKINPLIT